MIEVLESVELLAVVVMVGLAMWATDFIQRKFGHPLEYIPEDDTEE